MDILVVNIIPTVILLMMSAFFSSTETALFSIPKERISEFAHGSRKSDLWIYDLLNHGQRTLYLILLGNLFVNVTVVVFINRIIEHLLPNGSALYTLVIATFVLLFFGEIIPKNIALKNSETVAHLTAPVMYFLKQLTTPLLRKLEDFNVFLLGSFASVLWKPSDYITQEEFLINVHSAVKRGALTENEGVLIDKHIIHESTAVDTIMTHRSELLYLSERVKVRDALEAFKKKSIDVAFVQKHNTFRVIGLVHLHTLLKAESGRTVGRYSKKPYWVPETTPITEVMGDILSGSGDTVAVHDQYGMFIGAVSLDDCCRSFHKLTHSAVEDERGELGKNLIHRGKTELIDIQEIDCNEFKKYSLKEYGYSPRTLNGMITTVLGRIPKNGETIELSYFPDWEFYIVDANAQAIETIVIKRRNG